MKLYIENTDNIYLCNTKLYTKFLKINENWINPINWTNHIIIYNR